MTAAVSLVIGACLTGDANAVVWRSDLTEAEVIELAQQGQFAGVGIVRRPGSIATGAAIGRRWVLTAQHVVGHNQRVSFTLDGQRYDGTSVGHRNGSGGAASDVALIRLDADQALPTGTTLIAPNPGHEAVGPLVWKVGWGQSSSAANSQISRGPSGVALRAGTNIIQRTVNGTPGGPNTLIMQQNNTSPNSTEFEVSTAPGDSGSPLFLQHDNTWYIAGVTFGVVPGTGFAEANVAQAYSFITANTGQIFGSPTPPTAFSWDADHATTGAQSGDGVWNSERPNFEAGGFNYTWENDAPIKAVFGAGGPSVVNVTDNVVFSEIEFAADAGGGPFQINSAGGTLAAVAGGGTIDAKQSSRLGANLVGSEDVTKVGRGDLLVNGDNAAFGGQWFVNEGTMVVEQASSLGTGGFSAGTKTTIADGATLQLRGNGLTSGEHFHIRGDGFENRGAIHIDRGEHVLTEAIALRDDASIVIDAEESITFGGTRGQFYTPTGVTATLTQAGLGTAVYDRVNNIDAFVVLNGVAAGDGGIGGSVRLTLGSEMRPGDSASDAEFGSFRTGDFQLDSGSLLTIDLDPVSGLVDLMDTRGLLSIGGMLQLNLKSAPMLGQSFTFIQNDGSDAVVGMFESGRHTTAVFDGRRHWFELLYDADDGNNVALRSVTAVPEPGVWIVMGVIAASARWRRRPRRHDRTRRRDREVTAIRPLA